MPWLAILAVLVMILALAMTVGDRVSDRVLGLLLGASRGSGWLAVPVTVAYFAVVLGLLFVVAVISLGLAGDVGDGWLGALVGAVGVTLHAQLWWFVVPGQVTLYGPLREDLRRLGATRGQERGIAWTGGPLGILTIAASIGLLYELFA